MGGGDGSWAVPVLVALAAVAAVVGLVVTAAADRRRRERLLVWSAERGWRWDARGDGLEHLLPGEPFGRGHSRQASSVVQGRWGDHDALAFDYRFRETTGSGKNRRTRTYRFAVVALHLPVALPQVHVGPENAFHRLAQAFGADDIDVESEAFNRRYRVRAADRRGAFALLHPRLVEMLAHTEPVEWRTDVSSRGPLLLSWWSGRLEAVELQHRLVLLDAVVGQVPDYVWRDAGWEPGGPRPVA